MYSWVMMAMTMTMAVTIRTRIHHISSNKSQSDFCVNYYISHNDGTHSLLLIWLNRKLKNENIQRCGCFNVNIFLIQYCNQTKYDKCIEKIIWSNELL